MAWMPFKTLTLLLSLPAFANPMMLPLVGQLAKRPVSASNIQIVGTSTGQTYLGNTPNLNLTIPSGTASGDLLFMAISNPEPNYRTPGAGWTFYATAGSNPQLDMYWKIASGSDTTVTMSGSNSHAGTGAIVAIRGANPSSPFGSRVQANSSGSVQPFPSATTTTSGNLILFLSAHANIYDETFDAQATELADVDCQGETSRSLSIGWKNQPSPGTVTSPTITGASVARALVSLPITP